MLPEISNVFGNWAWLAWPMLGALPLFVIALYFLKLKRQSLEVPSTYLWHKSIEDLHVNALWQRLRQSLLLYLQLFVLLLILMALLRPSWRSLQIGGSRMVILIDNSASMQATDVQPTRLAEAKRRASELIDRMGSSDLAMLIAFSDVARVEQSFTSDRRRLREAVEAIQPTIRSTSLASALKLAGGLVNPRLSIERSPNASGQGAGDLQVADTKMIILSDGKFPSVEDFELGNLQPTFVPIGQTDAANVGIVAFNVLRQEENRDHLQAFAQLKNAGPTAVNVPLHLYLNDQTNEINADAIEIPPGQTRGVAFSLEGIESGSLHLRADTKDRLALDDEAWAVIPTPRRLRVLVVTPGDRPLEKILTTKSAAELADVEIQPPGFIKAKEYIGPAELGSWDLIVYDRVPPPQMPHCNTFFIGCIPPGGKWSTKKAVDLPQVIDAEISHRLMQWVDLAEIHYIVEATPLVAPSGGCVLMDSDAGPLLAIAPRDGFEDLVLGMKLIDQRADLGKDGAGKVETYRNTDWPLRVSFASFLRNLLSYTANGTGDVGTMGATTASYRPGSSVPLEAIDLRKPLVVHCPSGKTIEIAPLAGGKAVFQATDELGVYRVESAGKSLGQFAVNLSDPNESDIRSLENPSFKFGSVEVTGVRQWRSGHIDLWRGLLLIALAISLLEWYIYLRRVYFT